MANWEHGKTVVAFCIMAFALAACSGENKGAVSSKDFSKTENVPQAPAQPVTLKVFQQYATLSDDEFNSLIAEPVKKKFPHITMEIVRATAKIGAQELIASGEMPDLLFVPHTYYYQYVDLNLPYDLTGLVKQYKTDLGAYEPQAIEEIRMNGFDKNKMYALPFSLNFSATFYNKDIFDKFGISYPQDGLTWDDAIELAKRIGRTADGKLYYGLDTHILNVVDTQRTIPVIDYTTNTATLNTDRWLEFFNWTKMIFDIPPGNKSYGQHFNNFIKNTNLAMMPSFGSAMGQIMTNKELNWDMVSYPTLKELPGVGLMLDAHTFLLSSTSKHKEEAYQVMAFVTGDENSELIARYGRLPGRKDQKYKDMFGAGLPELKDKNVKGIFSTKYAAGQLGTTYMWIARNELRPAMNKFIAGTVVDANTALREAETIANQKIAAEKEARKK
jgi:multiple sugar transport system substrate-binding protein